MRDPAQRDRVVLGGTGRSGGLRRRGGARPGARRHPSRSPRPAPRRPGRRPSRPGPARGRSPARWRERGDVWRPAWSAGSGWPTRRRCRWHRLGAEVEAVGVVGVAELELGDLVPQLGQGGQVGLGLGRAQGPQPEVGDLVQLLGDGGDRGRDRVLSGVVECRCHTGNSGIGHRQSRTGNAAFPTAVEKYFESFWSPQRCGLDTRSLALAARPPESGCASQPPPCATRERTPDPAPYLSPLLRSFHHPRPATAREWSRHSLAARPPESSTPRPGGASNC